MKVLDLCNQDAATMCVAWGYLQDVSSRCAERETSGLDFHLMALLVTVKLARSLLARSQTQTSHLVQYAVMASELRPIHMLALAHCILNRADLTSCCRPRRCRAAQLVADQHDQSTSKDVGKVLLPPWRIRSSPSS